MKLATLTFLLLPTVFTSMLAAAPARLLSAGLRVGGATRSFDVPLLLNQSSIEPRDVSKGATIVLAFDRPADGIELSIASGKATLGPTTVAGNVLNAPLLGVVDGQEISLAIAGKSARGQSLQFRVLQGDVNADAKVDQADLRAIQQRIGQPISAANAKYDVTANGQIDSADGRMARRKLGQIAVGAPVRNTAPTITAIPPQKNVSGQTPAGIGFQVFDAETPASQLMVSAVSDNPAVLPNEAIQISGAGAARVLIAPTTGNGHTVVTVTVTDGQLSASMPFEYDVTAPPTLFVGRLTPQGIASSPGSGNATLLLAGDELSAVLRFTYSNLTGPETAAHIHGPADAGQSAGILFDIDTATPNVDGSYTWSLNSDANHTPAELASYIRQGKTYINIHTAAYPNGEIRAQFNLATGSQTFTAPAAPPALPTAPPTADEAARFLTQATFGPTESEITRVMAMGYAAWLDDQFRKPASPIQGFVDERMAAGEASSDNLFVECWWRGALTGDDQLRQRVAFALSQIMVISQQDGDIAGRAKEVAYYYDLLMRNAFGNYRTLLEEVTLNPEMGQYLDMRNNRKATSTTIPNENYAREILQLFSIGLYQLHPDGTLKLGIDGLPIATYGQPEVGGFARVFTGWNWHQSAQVTGPSADYFNPMTLITSLHEFGPKQILDGVTIPTRAVSVPNGLTDLGDALNQIAAHPNTGPFICRQLIQRMVTDNPSPGYVYRVSQVFANNGHGVRGDLKAVVKAILLDYEARAGYDVTRYPNSPVYTQGFGKLREPVLRAAAMIRAFRPTSLSGYFRVTTTDTAFSQSPMRSPTVFNFYEPGYAQPGAIAGEGLASPEFQILNEISVVSAANFLESATRNAVQGNDIRLDFSAEQALAADATALVNRLNLLLTYGQLSATTKQKIITQVNTVTASNTLERARTAVHLIVTSPEFSAQR